MIETTEHKETEQPQKETTKEETLFAGKYNSVDALEQGYRELSRLVREKTPVVPETYDIDFSNIPELQEVKINEDPLWEYISPAMREAGLSQPQAQQVTEAFVKWQMEQAQTEHANFEKMGHEGQMMAQQVTHFIDKNFTDSERPMAETLTASVDGLKFLHKIATLSGEKAVPAGDGVPPSDVKSLKEKAKEMLSDPELRYNRNKQDAYNRLWKDISNMS